MSLHIVIGYKSHLGSAKPELVYCGPSGSESRAAMEAQAEQFARFAVLNNPPSYRKAGKLKPVEAAPVSAVTQTSDTAEAEKAAKEAADKAAKEAADKAAKDAAKAAKAAGKGK